MRDTLDSFDSAVNSLVCLHTRYDWDPYGKVLFILSLSNLQTGIFTHYTGSHVGPIRTKHK